MKSLGICAVAVAVLLTAMTAQAELVLIEDFEAYDADSSIHLQGLEFAGTANEYPRWYTQANGHPPLTDNQWSNVREIAGNKVLEIINRDHYFVPADGLDVNFTSMSIWEYGIVGQGTIYVQYKSDTVSDCIMAGNDLWPGFGDYVNGIPGGDDSGYQIASGVAWMAQGPLVELGADEPFRARNGGGYNTTGPNRPAVWNEVWMQLDVANDRCKYWHASDGGAPVQMMSSSGEWWGFRNQTRNNNAIYNIAFLSSSAEGFETPVLIDNIAVDTAAWTTDGFDLPPTEQPAIDGDANGDGTVNLQDFVALKNNFGTQTGATWEMGDFNGDGAVNLEDFVILKNNFGATAS